MAGNQTFKKRERERARDEKKREKERRRQERKNSPRPPAGSGEDPDLAGIVPGPQPVEDE
jgi:hypothetical protein